MVHARVLIGRSRQEAGQAAALALGLGALADLGVFGAAEVLHDFPHLGSVAEGAHQGAGAQYGLVALHRREVEGVHGVGRAVREHGSLGDERGIEGRLAVHHAVVVDQRLAVVAERRRGDGATGGEHHSRRVPQVKHLVEHTADLVAGERQIAGDPRVVVRRRVEAQHQVLDPVGEGPAGGRTALDADAERGIAVRDHLGRQCLELVPGTRNSIALRLEQRRFVPHQRLQVGLVRNAVLGSVDVTEGRPRGRPVLVHRGNDIVGQRNDVAVACEVGQLARLREDEDVRRVAAGCLRIDLVCSVAGTGVGDLDACLRREVVQRIPQGTGLLVAGLGTEDGDLRPRQVHHVLSRVVAHVV